MTLSGTVFARVMSKYCLRFRTVVGFKGLEQGKQGFALSSGIHKCIVCSIAAVTLEKLLLFVSSAEEFADIHIRKGEKALLNDLNKASRFRQKGKVQFVHVRAAMRCFFIYFLHGSGFGMMLMILAFPTLLLAGQGVPIVSGHVQCRAHRRLVAERCESITYGQCLRSM